MKNHVHCIICSKPYEYEEEDFDGTLKGYVCNDCVHSFSSEYILHRIQCHKEGIYKKEFAILEMRLTRGSEFEFKYNSPNEDIFLWE